MKILLLFALISAIIEAFAGAAIIAKPALVPFTEDIGKILVHVDSELLQQCPQSRTVAITDESGLLDSRTDFSDLHESHVDRFGLDWVHVRVDLKRIPLGATSVKVTVCDQSVVTKASSV